MKRILKMVSVLCIAIVVPFAAFAQSDSIIKPWTAENNFNSASFDYTDVAAETSQWNLWPSTYTKVAVMKDCIAKVRDGYAGVDENTVYDGVSGIVGDKYAYFAYGDNWAEPTSNKNTGYLYFNDKSKANGGYCYGPVKYELDIRVSDITKADYSASCNGIQIYNADDKVVIKMPIRHGNASTWYFSKPTGLTDSPAALNCNEWYHITVNADYRSKTVQYTAKAYDTESSKKGFSTDVGTFSSASPLKTTLMVQCPLYANCSIDNTKVTKETYILGNTNISENDSAVTATVVVGNDVFADGNTSFGSAVDTLSPAVVLALYDSENNLISVDYKTVEFDNHSKHETGSTSEEMSAFLKTEMENKTVELSIEKPNVPYTASVYVLDNMGNLVPYAEPTQFDPTKQ